MSWRCGGRRRGSGREVTIQMLLRCIGHLTDVESLCPNVDETYGTSRRCEIPSRVVGAAVYCVVGVGWSCTHLMSGVCRNLPKKKPKRKYMRQQRANAMLCRCRTFKLWRGRPHFCHQTRLESTGGPGVLHAVVVIVWLDKS